MRKKRLDNKVLDALGRSVIKAGRMSDAEIERIVAAPQLFARIKARAKAAEPSALRRGLMPVFLRGALAFGAASIAAIMAAGYIYLSGLEPVSTDLTAVQIPAAPPEAARPTVPPEPLDGSSAKGRAANIGARPIRTSARRQSPVQKARPVTIDYREPEPAFYPLTFAGDPHETARGGRIVRMDVPRSKLFAMGVDLPLESELGSVKADLLIGPDGIARAIRIIDR